MTYSYTICSSLGLVILALVSAVFLLHKKD